MMWLVLFILMTLVSLGGLFYIAKGFHKFGIVKKISQKNKAAAWIISFAAVAVIGGVWLIFSPWAMLVVLIHLFVFWCVADAVSAIISKIQKKKPDKNYSGAAALAFTAVYLGIGWFMAHHIVPTYYTIETKQDIGGENLRIALIADSHLGITLDGEKFSKQMELISAENPDVMVVAGDFVDDNSCKADMIKSCEALGKIKTKYGVFFTFGNHDKGYYEGGRDFTEADLRAELEKNNITILEDETVMLRDNVFLTGRQDKQVEERMHFANLTKGYFAYDIVIDHQPNSYNEECEWGADLVLSGHTHGGHIFPVGIIQLLIKANDRVYGTEYREILGNRTDFIVTSGISGWAIPFKTFPKSEYVIIDVIPE